MPIDQADVDSRSGPITNFATYGKSLLFHFIHQSLSSDKDSLIDQTLLIFPWTRFSNWAWLLDIDVPLHIVHF